MNKKKFTRALKQKLTGAVCGKKVKGFYLLLNEEADRTLLHSPLSSTVASSVKGVYSLLGENEFQEQMLNNEVMFHCIKHGNVHSK